MKNNISTRFSIFKKYINFIQLSVVIPKNYFTFYVKPRENRNFLKKGKMVISVKSWNFSRTRMTKWTLPLESSREI